MTMINGDNFNQQQINPSETIKFYKTPLRSLMQTKYNMAKGDVSSRSRHRQSKIVF